MYMHTLCIPMHTCLYLHINCEEKLPPTQRLTQPLSNPNTFPFKRLLPSCCVQFQCVNSVSVVTRNRQSLVPPKLIGFRPPVASHFSSLTISHPSPNRQWFPPWEAAVSHSSDLWNDDRRAPQPYPSLFIALVCHLPALLPPLPHVCKGEPWLWSLWRWQMFLVTPSLKQTVPSPPKSSSRWPQPADQVHWRGLPQVRGQGAMEGTVTEYQIETVTVNQFLLRQALLPLCFSSPARVMLSPLMFSIYFEWCIALFRWCSLRPPNHYLVQSGTGLHPYHSCSFINQKKKKKEFWGEGDMQEWLDVWKNLMLSVSNWFSPNLSVAARSLKDISHIL